MVYFEDEARFGRMQNPVQCWAPGGTRPRVKLQRVREYTHVYSAVCPRTGDSFSLILPYASTDMMTIFLREFSAYAALFRVVMVMDGASWHTTAMLEPFENIRIIHQPPYSPEVNPVEHLWEHIREKYFRNGFRETMDELEDDLTLALQKVSRETDIIKKLTAFHWIIV